LTKDEIAKLKEKFPQNYERRIEALSEGIELKGYKYKNHYLAILKWAEREPKPKYDYIGYDMEAYERSLDTAD